MKKLILILSLGLVGCVVPPYQSYTPQPPAPSMYDYPQTNKTSAHYPQAYEQNEANYDNRVRVDVYHHQVEPQRAVSHPALNNEPSWQPSLGTLGSGLSGAF